MKLTFCYCVTLLLTFYASRSTAQSVLCEFTPKGKLDDFNISTIGDTIILCYKESLSNASIRKTSVIREALVSTDNIPVSIHAVTSVNDKTYFYYLSGKAKSRTLKALITEQKSGSRSESAQSIPIPETILGSYVDKDLFFILLDETGRNLSLLKINGLNIASDRKFTLPDNISAMVLSNQSDFFSGHSALNMFKGTSSVKLFKYDDNLFLVIDHSEGTSVTNLHLQTNEVTNSFFSANSSDLFSSFILDGKLFRVSNGKKKFVITIVDMNTKEQIASNELPEIHEDFNVYFRYGRKNIITQNAKFSQMMKDVPVSTPTINVVKDQDSYVIQWSGYYNQNGMVLPTPSISGVIGALVGTALLQAREKPGVHRYFNYEWDHQNAFKIRDLSTMLLKEKIDQFEIKNRTRVDYKSYIAYKGGLAAVYYEAKKNNLSVIHFD